jgi:hypothetical protein
MPEVATSLRWLFANFLYPLAIIGVLAFASVVILRLFRKTRSARVATAAILPIVVLAFTSAAGVPSSQIANVFLKLSWLGWLLGVMSGVASIELGRYLLRRDTIGGAAVYALFVSSSAAFILYVVMSGSLEATHSLLMGFLIGGGLDIVFRGLPEYRVPISPEQHHDRDERPLANK